MVVVAAERKLKKMLSYQFGDGKNTVYYAALPPEKLMPVRVEHVQTDTLTQSHTTPHTLTHTLHLL